MEIESAQLVKREFHFERLKEQHCEEDEKE